jgi:hypothetical protein
MVEQYLADPHRARASIVKIGSIDRPQKHGPDCGCIDLRDWEFDAHGNQNIPDRLTVNGRIVAIAGWTIDELVQAERDYLTLTDNAASGP